MALTADQITAKNFKKFYQALEPYLSGGVHGGFTPVGSIIAVMGNNAPTNYLKCDGAIYNIEDYPELANYFEEQFDNANFFGGDGATTFAVPDLRGEFLRGTGTNSHTDQGDGSNVGEHQDGSEHLALSAYAKTLGLYYEATGPKWTSNAADFSGDAPTGSSTGIIAAQLTSNTGAAYLGKNTVYRSRPTNTSVLYCIATKNIFLDVADFGEEVDENDIKEIIGSNMPSARQNFIEYSTNEQMIGTWIDGKPLYQKTVVIESPTNNARNQISGFDFLNTHNLVGMINASALSATQGLRIVTHFLDSNSYFQVNVGGDGTSLYISWGSTAYGTLTNLIVTIQYTKTTD